MLMRRYLFFFTPIHSLFLGLSLPPLSSLQNSRFVASVSSLLRHDNKTRMTEEEKSTGLTTNPTPLSWVSRSVTLQVPNFEVVGVKSEGTHSSGLNEIQQQGQCRYLRVGSSRFVYRTGFFDGYKRFVDNTQKRQDVQFFLFFRLKISVERVL